MDWRPMETAPRDSTPVLVVGGVYDSGNIWGRCGAPLVEASKAFWLFDGDDGDWPTYADCADQRRHYNPTHWMPLPAPPGTDPRPAAAGGDRRPGGP